MNFTNKIVLITGASRGIGRECAVQFAEAGAKVAVHYVSNEAAADETVKAVVLRVNSPGGSATASEIILDATKRVKAKKPLIVSMGPVAGNALRRVASGLRNSERMPINPATIPAPADQKMRNGKSAYAPTKK